MASFGIWGALSNVYPEASERRCWNHKIVNVPDKLPNKALPRVKRRVQEMAYAESRAGAKEKRALFLRWCQKEGYRAAGDTLLCDWEGMVTFYRFPKEQYCLVAMMSLESPDGDVSLVTPSNDAEKHVNSPFSVCSPFHPTVSILMAKRTLRMGFFGVSCSMTKSLPPGRSTLLASLSIPAISRAFSS